MLFYTVLTRNRWKKTTNQLYFHHFSIENSYLCIDDCNTIIDWFFSKKKWHDLSLWGRVENSRSFLDQKKNPHFFFVLPTQNYVQTHGLTSFWPIFWPLFDLGKKIQMTWFINYVNLDLFLTSKGNYFKC